jgi:DNA-binding transcriptional MocR family regulator
MMQIAIDRQGGTPIYLQIANQLRQAIHDGETPNGSRLPPERRLAALLGVNRTTIVNAYRELAADGLVSGQVGRGTIVTYGAPASADVFDAVAAADAHEAAQRINGYGNGSPLRGDAPAPIPWAQLFTSVTDVMDDPLLHDAMTASARPDVVRFATGIPAPELYPIDLIRELFDEALHQAGQSLLQYTPTEGYPPLRDELAAWMSAAARHAGAPASFDARDVIVVAGSQQGLYLLARTLIEPGDLVAIESPTYLGAAQVFRAAGARLLPIPVDADGMQVDILSDTLARRRPKLIYTLPTFQNPSGATLAMGRRLRLLDIAARLQIPIIEDDPYGALRYEGRPLPSLAALERAEGRGAPRAQVI